jgi:hypothetical protein
MTLLTPPAPLLYARFSHAPPFTASIPRERSLQATYVFPQPC